MSDNRERDAFELLRSLRGDYNCSCGHPKCSKAATQREIDEVLAAQPEQPSGWVVPDMTSAIVNDCCWTFVEAMPHNLPGPIFNDLKPALYEALKQYHGSMLTAAPAAPAVQGGGVPEPVCLVRQNEAGQICMCKPDGSAFQLYNHVGQDFYTHPHNGEQPSKWRRTLERIARYPRTRSEELSAPGMREMAREALSDLYPHLHESAHHNGEQGGEWVRCDERLPDKTGHYCVALSDPGDVGWSTAVSWTAFWNGDGFEDCDPIEDGQPVTHWMPMPQPPKSKEGESGQ